MPVGHSPPRTRSKARLEVKDSSTSEFPLLVVTKQPVAPISPPPQLGRGTPPPSPEGNIRDAQAGQEPLVIEPRDEQHLLPQPQQEPLPQQQQPQQQQPPVDQHLPIQVNEINPEMANQVPPALNSWEAFAQALMAPRPVLPEFHGLDYENPSTYLTKCTEYFTALQVPEAQKVSVLEKGLKGNAEKWWKCYQLMGLTYDGFSELLKAQFDGQALKSSLVAKLYGTAQGEKEIVGTFLQTKYMLYGRLRPDETEATKVATLIELLRPSIRKMIRSHNVGTFAELLSKAQEVEKDETDEKQQSNPKPKAKDQGQKDPPRTEKTLPKCYYCPGYHYNRNCPTREGAPKENWRGGGTPPAPPTQPPADQH
ncbi:hypothetical protein TKK_0014558 [Trichogramma kaykai]|uniref:Ty3 transposon capsid-like protein domain-containing protein n=1 Tax=Trichogramma kaykai TaxID=54128 RepID=A0ABD2WDH8_9HYME